MSEYRIEKGIPLPERQWVRHLFGAKAKYPWREMEIDDSFLVPGGAIHTMTAAASKAGKRIGMTFACRQRPSGIRVWRTA